MDCSVECCIDCYTTSELIQVWIEVSFKLTLRVIVQIVRSGPVFIVVGGCAYTYYRLKYRRIIGEATVITGNTIEVKGIRIRFIALSALRPGQPLTYPDGKVTNGGKFSKDALAKKIDGKRVRCRIYYKGAYDRLYVRCYLKGDDIGRWLVRHGYAVAEPHYGNLYVSDEHHARRKKLGIHAGKFERPSTWGSRTLRERLLKQYRNIGLRDDPAELTTEALRIKVGFKWKGGILVDSKGANLVEGLMEAADYA